MTSNIVLLNIYIVWIFVTDRNFLTGLRLQNLLLCMVDSWISMRSLYILYYKKIKIYLYIHAAVNSWFSLV